MEIQEFSSHYSFLDPILKYPYPLSPHIIPRTQICRQKSPHALIRQLLLAEIVHHIKHCPNQRQIPQNSWRLPQTHLINGPYDRTLRLHPKHQTVSSYVSQSSARIEQDPHLARFNLSWTQQTPIHISRLLLQEGIIRVMFGVYWDHVPLNLATSPRDVHQYLPAKHPQSDWRRTLPSF